MLIKSYFEKKYTHLFLPLLCYLSVVNGLRFWHWKHVVVFVCCSSIDQLSLCGLWLRQRIARNAISHHLTLVYLFVSLFFLIICSHMQISVYKD